MISTDLTRVGPYEIVEPIGRGAHSRVYRARRRDDPVDVAIKILDRDVMRGEVRERFLAEARLVRLLDDPAIPRIHEVGHAGGVDFIVMDLVAGRALDEILRDRGRLSVAEVVRIGHQLARVLVVAHAAGVRHGDLKPANVMLSPDGRLQLLDFGLSMTIDPDAMTVPGRLTGTVAYMAPEQLLGEALDARADIYAASAVLYELLAGRRPSLGDRFETLVHAILNVPPPRLGRLGIDVPEPVERVVVAGLAKSVGDRYPTTADMLRDWEILYATGDPSQAATRLGVGVDVYARLARERHVPILGRERELAGIERAARRVRDGGAEIVVVEGDAGLGKSRLLDEAVGTLDTMGYRVVRAQCDAGGSAYRLWVDLLRELLADLDANGAAGLTDALARMDLRVHARVLTSFLGYAADAAGHHRPDVDELADPGQRIVTAIAAVVERGAEDRPVAFVIDDLDRADTLSRSLIGRVAELVPHAPVLTVATSTSRFWSSGSPAPALGMVGDRGNRVLTMQLRGLSGRQVAELVRERLGDADELEALAEQISFDSRGNPLHVVEMLTFLETRGLLRRRSGRWVLTGPVRGLPLPRRLADALAARVDALTDVDRRTLETAAVAGDTFRAHVVARASGVTPATGLGVLRRLEAEGGLVVSTPSGYRFTSRAIREQLHRRLDEARAREIHGALGDAYVDETGDDTHARIVAEHLLQGGRYEAAAEMFERAAERDFSLFVNDAAAEAFERARAIWEDHDPEAGLPALCRLGRRLSAVEVRCGRLDDALLTASLVEPLTTRLGDASELGELRLVITEARSLRDGGDRALETAALARDAFARAGDEGGLARVAELEGVVRQHQGRISDALDRFDEALRRATAIEDSWTIARAHYRRGSCLRRLGRLDESLESLRAARDRLSESGDVIAAASASGEIGSVLFQRREYDEASAEYLACLRVMRASGDVRRHAIAVMNAGNADFARGALLGAINLYREALRLRLALGDDGGIGRVQLNLAHVYLHVGLYRHAVLAAHDALERCERLEDPRQFGNAAALVGVLYRDLGEVERADDAFRSAEEVFAGAGLEARRRQARLERAALAASTGDVDAARGILSDERSADGGDGTPAADSDDDADIGTELEIARAAGDHARAAAVAGRLVDAMARAGHRLQRLGAEVTLLECRTQLMGAGTPLDGVGEYAELGALARRLLGRAVDAHARPLELRIRFAGAEIVGRRRPADAIETLLPALARADEILPDVPPDFRLGWATRFGYLRALKLWESWARELPDEGIRGQHLARIATRRAELG